MTAHYHVPSITTGQLASIISAQLVGPPDLILRGVESADRAVSGHLTFVRSAKFAAAWRSGLATAALVAADVPLDRVLEDVITGNPGAARAILLVPDADLAMIAALECFAPPEPAPWQSSGAGAQIHASAVIHPTASVAATAFIGPLCVVGPGAVIGHEARLVAHVTIGAGGAVGARTVLYPSVTVYDRCRIGADCMIHGGVVIGADGFGYHPRADGQGVIKIPHIGDVVIEDHVEIGANTCVDRGKFGSSVIGAGTKIDNLVQIGHNCRIGRSCIICGEVGLSGSVTLGDGVVLGGRVGVADNVTIGAGARVAAYSGVTGNIPAGETYMGAPAGPVQEWRRIYGYLRRLGKNRAATSDSL